MDEDARRLLELLRPAVERAEQIGQQQQALLQRHEESAQAFADHIGKIKEAAETERARLLAEREAGDSRQRIAGCKRCTAIRGYIEGKSVPLAVMSDMTWL